MDGGRRPARRPGPANRHGSPSACARRLDTLRQGSLRNDATVLVVYPLAVGAVVAGIFLPCDRRVRHLPGAVRSLRAAPDCLEQVAPQPRRGRLEKIRNTGNPAALPQLIKVQVSAL